MRALVTGATGFLGSRIAHVLRQRGHAVRTLARPTSDLRRVAGLDVETVRGDITDRESVRRALDGCDVVVHSAAMYELGTADADRMARVNVGGTTHVLEVAAELGVLAVHVSSVAALGPTGPEPADESHWSDDAPRSAYEATKREAHRVARALVQRGANVRIGLPPTIYGPDDPSLIGALHRWYARGVIPIGALPHMRMTFVHVDDCAEGLVRMAERSPAGREIILAAQSVTVREWFDTLSRTLGRRPPRLYVPDRWARRLSRFADVAPRAGGRLVHLAREILAMSAGQNWWYSGDRARQELDWQPRSFEAGIAEVVAFYGRS